MDKICVLGIESFTGKHYQQFIREQGLKNNFEFLGIDRKISNNNIPCIDANIMNDNELREVLCDFAPHYIINFVGTNVATDFKEATDVNTFLCRRICEMVLTEQLPVKKLLFIGSAAEYGSSTSLPIREDNPLHPMGIYGLSKVIQTQLAQYYYRKHNLPINVARTFNIIGQGLSNSLSIGSFAEQIRQAKDGDTIEVGNLSAKRDFLNIKDVLAAYWAILHQALAGEVYNVCRGSSISIQKVLDQLIKYSGKQLTVKVISNRLRNNEIVDIYGDNAKLREATDWKPSNDIENALAAMVK